MTSLNVLLPGLEIVDRRLPIAKPVALSLNMNHLLFYYKVNWYFIQLNRYFIPQRNNEFLYAVLSSSSRTFYAELLLRPRNYFLNLQSPDFAYRLILLCANSRLTVPLTGTFDQINFCECTHINRLRHIGPWDLARFKTRKWSQPATKTAQDI